LDFLRKHHPEFSYSTAPAKKQPLTVTELTVKSIAKLAASDPSAHRWHDELKAQRPCSGGLNSKTCIAATK